MVFNTKILQSLYITHFYSNNRTLIRENRLLDEVGLKYTKLNSNINNMHQYHELRYFVVISTIVLIIVFSNNFQCSFGQINKENMTNIEARNILINSVTNKSYFASLDENKIYVINETSKEIITSITTPETVDEMRIDVTTGLLYAGPYISFDEIYVIDGNIDEMIDTIKIDWIHDFEVNTLTNKLYLLDTHSDSFGSYILEEIDLITKNVMRQIPLQVKNAHMIELMPSQDLIYIGHGDEGMVSIINASTSLRNLEYVDSIQTSKYPSDMISDLSNNKLYIINDKINRLSVIDTKDNSVETIVLNSPSEPEEPKITIDNSNNRIYISNPQEGLVTLINKTSHKLITSVYSGTYPTNLIFNPIGNQLYVTSLTDQVSILNVSNDFVKEKYLNYTKENLPGITVNGSPSSLVLDPESDRAYVSYKDLEEISIIDISTDKVVESITLDFIPLHIALNSETKSLYVTSNNTLYTIDTLDNRINPNNLSLSEPINNLEIDTVNNRIYLHTNGDFDDEGINYVYQHEDGKFNQIDSFNSSEHLHPQPLLSIINEDGGFSNNILSNTNDRITYSWGYDPVVDLDYDHLKELAYVLTDKYLYKIDFISGSSKNISRVDSIFVSDMSIDPNREIIYVSDELRNVVQVINGSGTVIDEIAVGDSPTDIDLNSKSGIIYVTNSGSKMISVINASSNKVQVPHVVFDINPRNSGYISCEGISVATNNFQRIDIGNECEAVPNRGYEFSNWVEYLGNNSTKTVSSIIKNYHWYTPFENFIKYITNNLGLDTSKNDASVWTVSRSGNFTANFEMVAPPLPAEYWATLTSFVLTTIVGAYFIPSFIGFTRTRSKVKKQNYFHREIQSIYDDGRLDDEDTNKLNILKNKITDSYSRGKISDEQYDTLNTEISISYDEIFNKRIDALRDDETLNQSLKSIEDDVTKAFSKGRLLELQYKLLKEKIEILRKRGQRTPV